MYLYFVLSSEQIIVEHLDKIAARGDDPLRELITLMGREPNLDSFVLQPLHNQSGSSLPSATDYSAASRNTQLCLTLASRYTPTQTSSGGGDDKADINSLFIKYDEFQLL